MKFRTLKKCVGVWLAASIVGGITFTAPMADEISTQDTITFSYEDPIGEPPQGTPGTWSRTTMSNYPYGGTNNMQHQGEAPDADYAITTEMGAMQSGRAIISKVTSNVNLFQTFTDQPDTLTLTGQHNNVYHISWNQYLSEKEEGHTAKTINRGPQIRISTTNTAGDDTLFAGFFSTENSTNREFYPAIAYVSDVKASGTQPLEKGKWYHCDFYLYANCTSSAGQPTVLGQDSFVFTCYEYGGDGTDMQTVVLDNSGGAGHTSGYRNLGFYEYMIAQPDEQNFHGLADLNITKYTVATGEACSSENLADVAEINELKAAADSFKPVFAGEAAAEKPLNAPNAFEVTQAGDIPMTAPEGTTLTWSSNNTSVISFDNGTPVVTEPMADTYLCLTATLTDENGYSVEKSFPVMVAKGETNGTVTETIGYNDEIGSIPNGWKMTEANYPEGGKTFDTSYSITQRMPLMESGRAIVTGTQGRDNLRLYRWMDNPIRITEGNNNIYRVSWNQYLSPNSQPHTANTPNRGPQIRICSENDSDRIFAGFFNNADGFVPGLGFADSEYTYGDTVLETGKWYHCDLYIYANTAPDAENDSAHDSLVLRCYEYGGDEADAQEISLSPEKISTSQNGYRFFMLYDYNLSSTADRYGYHGFSDIKITTYPVEEDDTESINKINSLKNAVDSFSPGFGGSTSNDTALPSSFIVSKDSDIPTHNLPAGISEIVWRSSNTDVIEFDECGANPVIKDVSVDTNLCLTAVLKDENGYTAEKSFPVTVKAQSNAVAKADFSGYEAGTTVSGITGGNGWSGGFTLPEKTGDTEYDERIDNLANSELETNEYGTFLKVTSAGSDTDTELVRELDNPLNLETDATYYLKWRAKFGGGSAAWEYQKFIFKGAEFGVRDNEFSLTTITDASSNVALMPLRTPNGVKTDIAVSMEKDTYYDYVVRIDASRAGQDRVRVKYYKAGEPEPAEYAADYSSYIDGVISAIGFDNAHNAEFVNYFGGVDIDSVTTSDAAVFEQLETRVNEAATMDEANNIIAQAPIDGAWKASLQAMASGKSRTGIAYGDSTLEDSDNTKVFSVSNITNNSGETVKVAAIVAVYDTDGRLIRADLSDADIENGTVCDGLTASAEFEEGNIVKTFIWEMNTLQPIDKSV